VLVLIISLSVLLGVSAIVIFLQARTIKRNEAHYVDAALELLLEQNVEFLREEKQHILGQAKLAAELAKAQKQITDLEKSVELFDRELELELLNKKNLSNDSLQLPLIFND
jgi:hypothetical protein